MKAKRKKTKRKLVKVPRMWLLRRQWLSDGRWEGVGETNRQFLVRMMNDQKNLCRNAHIIEISGGTVEI